MIRRAFLASTLFGVICACAAPTDEAATSESKIDQPWTCDASRPRQALARLLEAPVVPAQVWAGVEREGGRYGALSIADLERAFCQSDPITESEQSATVGWGNAPNHEVVVTYDKSTHRMTSFKLNAGYRGTIDFVSRPSALGDSTKPNPFGSHRYTIAVGAPILRDGLPFPLDWKASCAGASPPACFEKRATELFDALMYTFAPGLPSTQGSCVAEGMCVAKSDATGGGVFGARPLEIYLHVPRVDADEPAASTPIFLSGSPVKPMPASVADTFLELDDQGPEAVSEGVGDRRTRCAVKLGMPFAAYLADCVFVTESAAKNAELGAKLLAGATRTIQTSENGVAFGTWNLDVSGFHADFASERFDETEPAPTARATRLVLDGRAIGRVWNDYSPDRRTLSLEGTAAVYREYARLVQAFLHEHMDPMLPRFSIGDPRCLIAPESPPASWRTWTPERGCTGMEHFVTAGDPSTTTDAGGKRVSVGREAAEKLGLGAALRPGPLVAVFCPHPGSLDTCGPPGGAPLFDATRARAIALLGGDQPSTVPAAIKDRKIYVRLWTKALVKYLRAASQRPTDLADPRFDAFLPEDGDIVIESLENDLLRVKYRDKLEYRVHYLSGVAEQLAFH